MKILSFDTSSSQCSVALYIDGVVVETVHSETRAHGGVILGFIDKLLKQENITLKDLNFIAFGAGPGSFTGLRIAASVAQGLAMGAELPLVPVSSLKAMAFKGAKTYGYQNITVAFDARMGEVYWQCFRYQDDNCVEIETPLVLKPEETPLLDSENYLALGSGWKEYPKLRLRHRDQIKKCVPEVFPMAQAIAELALKETPVSAELALPIYIRNKVT